MDVTAKAETSMHKSYNLVVFAFCSNFDSRFAYGHRRSGNQWYCVVSLSSLKTDQKRESLACPIAEILHIVYIPHLEPIKTGHPA